MPRFHFEIAGPDDSDDLRHLFENAPMDGAIRVALERPGDFFHGAGVQSISPRVVVARDHETGMVVACCSAGTRDVFVNGAARPVFYIGDLRIHPSARGGTVLARGFRFLRDQVMNVAGDFAQTMVLQENKTALQILTSGRAGLPRYCDSGDYDCFAVRTGRSQRSPAHEFEIRRAHHADISAMQEFFDREAPKKQFFPAYRFSEIGTSSFYRDLKLEDFWLVSRGNELVGLAAAWDQSRYKRTRIAGYSPAMTAARPAVNLFARLSGGFRLPPPGTAPAHFYINSVVCRENDPAVFSVLIATIRNEFAKGPFEYFLCGLDRRDPLRGALEAFPKMNYPGRHILVSYDGDPRGQVRPGIFYFEAARI